MKLPDYEEGSVVAQYVVDQLDGKEGNVVVIHGTEGMSNTTVRGAGITDTLATAAAPITILDTKYTDWKKDQAMAAMENFISQYGETIDYVICSYEPLAEGAAEAIEAAGLQDSIEVLSIGISSSSKQYQLDGKIAASCTVEYKGMSLTAMQDFAALANGEEIEPEYAAGYELIVGDEIADYTPEY
jgi:ABC-type sugar transport system substrate-binding protein